MSKPKGRRRPLRSEITSLLRSTDTEHGAEEGTRSGAAEATDSTGPAPEPELEPSDGGAGAATAEPVSDGDPEGAAAELDGGAAAAAASAAHELVAKLQEPAAVEGADFESVDTQVRTPSNVISIDGAEAGDTEAYLCGLIEALLFTSQRPLPLKDIARSAGIDRPRARELLERLSRNYAPRGINIEEAAGGYVLRSSPRYASQVQKFLSLRPVRLSRAQLETLAIVAYRQPVTKPEVDDIRGVDSGQVLKGLLERDLLKILGKKDEPGRPMLYGTTNDFLELLNLRSLSELPTLREYTELSEESRRKFAEETGEAAPDEIDAGLAAEPNADADGAGASASREAPIASAAAAVSASELEGGAADPATAIDAAPETLESDTTSQLDAAGDEDEPNEDEDDEDEDEDDEDEDEDEEDEDDEDDEDEDDEDDKDDEDDDEE